MGVWRLALVGNPNCGKTTLFNALTGGNQYVGNWPGVTVEKKAGKTLSKRSELIDLPGLYSLSPCSLEEAVARDYLLKEAPDGIINIIDGANLERNCYLTVALLELGIPMVVAVNMMDEVEKKGWRLDCAALGKALGVPVIPVTARRGAGVSALLREAEAAAKEHRSPSPAPHGEAAERALTAMAALCRGEDFPRFSASRLLEGDREALSRLSREKSGEAERIARAYERSDGGRRDALLADDRYRFIEAVSRRCLKKGGERAGLSERIDRLALGKYTGLPLFLLLLLGVFALTFGPVGSGLSKEVERLFSQLLAPLCRTALLRAHAPVWCAGLSEAVLSGVSGVVFFLPQIALLFFCLTLLEDSGYMARTAFLMDRFFKRLGLSGKSFIPMLMGFGCTTPALMAARALPSERDRRMTMLLLPYMSCSARLPIYALFAGTFFPGREGLAVFLLYLLGVLTAILTGALLRKTVFRGETSPFIMELPPYRAPLLSAAVRHVWERCKGFLWKAGTLIVGMSAAIWVLQNLSPDLSLASDPGESLLGQAGNALAPLFAPLGFGSWQAVVALLSGLVSKESVVGTLSVLYAAGDASLLPAALQTAFTPASAASFMVFSLLYTPCISAFATMKKEMNSLPWAAASAALSCGTAWLAGFLTYQIFGLFFESPAVSAMGQPAAGSAACWPAALPVILLLLGAARLFSGSCCTGCGDCPMREKCKSGQRKPAPRQAQTH